MHRTVHGRLLLLGVTTVVLTACQPREEPDPHPPMMADRMPGMMSDTPPGLMHERMPMMDGMPEWMMTPGAMMDPQMMQEMRVIRGLLMNHERIQRAVEDLPNGVRTETTSEDTEVTELIRTHVRQMDQRFDRDQPIRMMDPVFRELFEHRHRASLEYEEIPGGMRVLHTSPDPAVVLLIRQHAHRFVSEAAQQGMRRAMQPTPLPEGYQPEN
jgi:hypothetical protein